MDVRNYDKDDRLPKLERSGKQESLLVEPEIRYRSGQLGKLPVQEEKESEISKTSRVVLAVAMVVLGLGLVAGVGFALWYAKYDAKSRQTEEKPDEGPKVAEMSPDDVAAKFLATTDIQKRLELVRNPEEVKERVSEYAYDAANESGYITQVAAYLENPEGQMTSFVVGLSGGGVRILDVIETDEGPKVDWDAYARYNEVSWDDLISGSKEKGLMRVFAQTSEMNTGPFSDRQEWDCYILSSPELEGSVLAYAKKDSPRTELIQEKMRQTRSGRKRFVFELVRHQGEDEALFEITQVVGVDWIVGDVPAEEIWKKEKAEKEAAEDSEKETEE